MVVSAKAGGGQALALGTVDLPQGGAEVRGACRVGSNGSGGGDYGVDIGVAWRSAGVDNAQVGRLISRCLPGGLDDLGRRRSPAWVAAPAGCPRRPGQGLRTPPAILSAGAQPAGDDGTELHAAPEVSLSDPSGPIDQFLRPSGAFHDEGKEVVARKGLAVLRAAGEIGKGAFHAGAGSIQVGSPGVLEGDGADGQKAGDGAYDRLPGDFAFQHGGASAVVALAPGGRADKQDRQTDPSRIQRNYLHALDYRAPRAVFNDCLRLTPHRKAAMSRAILGNSAAGTLTVCHLALRGLAAWTYSASGTAMKA